MGIAAKSRMPDFHGIASDLYSDCALDSGRKLKSLNYYERDLTGKVSNLTFKIGQHEAIPTLQICMFA